MSVYSRKILNQHNRSLRYYYKDLSDMSHFEIEPLFIAATYVFLEVGEVNHLSLEQQERSLQKYSGI